MSTFFRRHLPHHHPPDAACFVTFRLAGSLPAEVVARLQKERDDETRRLTDQSRGMERRQARREARKRYFARLDALLDRAQHSPRWLTNPQCARIVMDTLFAYQPEHYRLRNYSADLLSAAKNLAHAV